jgi:hypothetical protein
MYQWGGAPHVNCVNQLRILSALQQLSCLLLRVHWTCEHHCNQDQLLKLFAIDCAQQLQALAQTGICRQS